MHLSVSKKYLLDGIFDGPGQSVPAVSALFPLPVLDWNLELVQNLGRLVGMPFSHSRNILPDANTVLGGPFHMLRPVCYIITNGSLESPFF